MDIAWKILATLGLVALNRTPQPRHWLPSSNPAFLIVAAGALVLLLLATQVPAVGLWFRFAPPPPLLSAAAFSLPLGVLALVDAALRRVRQR